MAVFFERIFAANKREPLPAWQRYVWRILAGLGILLLLLMATAPLWHSAVSFGPANCGSFWCR
jgi:hypothetical protein